MGSRIHRCTICAYVHSENCYPDGTLYRGMSMNDDVAALQHKLIGLKLLKDRPTASSAKRPSRPSGTTRSGRALR